MGKSRVTAAFHILAHLFENIQIKLGNKAVLFKNGNEFSWTYHTLYRVIPTNQSLRAYKPLCFYSINGLIINAKFSVFKRPSAIVADLLFIQHIKTHFLVIISDMRLITAIYRSAGD